MFTELKNEELNSLYLQIQSAKTEAFNKKDEISWKALFSIEEDLNKEMRERAAALKTDLVKKLLGDGGGDGEKPK